MTLGAGAILDGDFTLEFFAMNRTVRDWSRIFEVTDSGSKANAMLFSWNRGTAAAQQRFEILKNSADTFIKDDQFATIATLTPYHITVSVATNYGGSGQSLVRVGVRDLTGADPPRAFEYPTLSAWTPTNLISRVLTIGKSAWGNNAASANYDEVRVWVGSLTVDQLATSAADGADHPYSSLLIDGNPVLAGIVEPDYGYTYGLASNATIQCSATSDVTGASGFAGTCSGYVLYACTNGVETLITQGTESSFAHTAPGYPCKLVWQWDDLKVHISTSVGEGGGGIEVSPASGTGLYTPHSIVTITATPDANHDFVYWSGDVPAGVITTDPSITFPIDRPRHLIAVFGPPNVYLKADATGDGSGSSWANACSNLTQAVAAAQTSTAPIYAAGGLYISSGDARVTAFDGMKIYGGFPGVSDAETLSGRDVDLYQTIFTQDRTTNDYWISVKPDYENYGVIETPLPGEPVLKNGRVNLPAYQGEDDAYRARAQNNSGTIGISVPASAKTVIDGLWFAAAGHSDGILYHAANCGVSTVVDCRFVGIYSGIITQDRSGGGAYTVTYHRCRYINCNGGGGDTLGDGGQAQQSYGGTRYFDSVFVGNCRKNGYMSGLLYGWGGSIASWNCRFERIITVTTSESNEIDRGGRSAVYSYEQGPQGDFKDCVFKRIYTTSTCKYGTPLLAAGSSALTDCAFVNNFYECKPVVGRAYCLVGNPEKSQGTIIADGCSFVGNTVSAPGAVSESGWAIGVLGGGGQSYRHVVVNCTFASNAVAVAGAPDASAIVRSQGLLSSALGTSSSTEAGVANCTFVNTAAEGVCDIAQFGGFHAKDLYVMNGVFAGGKTAPTPFSASVPGGFHVRDCTVGNFHTAPGWLDVEGLETDDVPLEAFADDATGRPLFRPLARTPGLRDTYDFATNTVLSAV